MHKENTDDQKLQGLVNRLTDAVADAGADVPCAIAALLAAAHYQAEGNASHMLFLRVGLIRIYDETMTSPCDTLAAYLGRDFSAASRQPQTPNEKMRAAQAQLDACLTTTPAERD